MFRRTCRSSSSLSRQYLYICQVLYACAIASTKIGIIASYLRFIQDKTFRLVMYGTVFVIVSLWFTGLSSLRLLEVRLIIIRCFRHNLPVQPSSRCLGFHNCWAEVRQLCGLPVCELFDKCSHGHHSLCAALPVPMEAQHAEEAASDTLLAFRWGCRVSDASQIVRKTD